MVKNDFSGVSVTQILLWIYGLIALVFLFNSYREGEEQGGQWDVMRVLGLLATIVWPLLLIGSYVA
eukprot:gene65718-89906_t